MITYVSLCIYIYNMLYIEYNIQYIYTVLAKVISFWAGTFGVTELAFEGFGEDAGAMVPWTGAVSWEAQTKMCPGCGGEICHFCGVS